MSLGRKGWFYEEMDCEDTYFFGGTLVLTEDIKPLSRKGVCTRIASE